MKFGDRVRIRGFDGFYDDAKVVLIDIGMMQNPHTKDTETVYVVEVNGKYHKNVMESQLEPFEELKAKKKGFDKLVEENNVQQTTTD